MVVPRRLPTTSVITNPGESRSASEVRLTPIIPRGRFCSSFLQEISGFFGVWTAWSAYACCDAAHPVGAVHTPPFKLVEGIKLSLQSIIGAVDNFQSKPFISLIFSAYSHPYNGLDRLEHY